jgi:alpha-tubulin suppressor-like RCC1 family protein
MMVLAGSAFAHDPGAGLRVTVSGLPGGQVARLVVRGPGGFYRVLAHSATITHLRPGVYRVAVARAPLHGSLRGEVAFPVADRVSAVARRGRVVGISVRYGTVSRASDRVGAIKVLRVAGTPAAPAAITVGANARGAVGQVLGLPRSPQLPFGLFAVVTGVTRKGTTETLRLRPARLSDAFTAVAVDRSVPLNLAFQQATDAGRSRAGDITGGVSRHGFGCGPGSSVSAQLKFSEANLLVQIDQPYAGRIQGQVSVAAVGTGTVNASLQGSCALSLPIFGPRYLGTVPVGPYLIPVWGSFSMTLSATLPGALNLTASDSLGATAGMSFVNTHVSPIAQLHNTAWASASVTGGSFDIRIMPTITAYLGQPEVKDAPFLDANASLGFGFQVTNAHNGCWINAIGEVDAALEGGFPKWGSLNLSLPALQTPTAPIVPCSAPSNGNGNGNNGSPTPSNGNNGGGPGGGGGGGWGGNGTATIRAMAVGGFHACAALSTGNAKCWGYDAYGELGDGSTTNPPAGSPNPADGRWTPVPVVGVTSATAITAGERHTCALLADGTIECWGLNQNGQLGNGDLAVTHCTAIPCTATPVRVTGISNAIQIAAGTSHTCALIAGGTVECWGANWAGQLGDGTTTESSIPVPVVGISDAIAIAAGYGHTCALLAGGTIECWGLNQTGELGTGSAAGPEECPPSGDVEYPCSTVPVAVGAITNASAIAAGRQDTCALVGGAVDCWGFNWAGQLGNGTTTDSATPVPVNGIASATAISAADSHVCALLAAGGVDCWGSNMTGQLGNGTDAGPQQCADATASCSTTPVPVSGLAHATAIAVGGGVTGGGATCASMSSGALECWGANGWGQLGNGTATFDSSTPVAVQGIP